MFSWALMNNAENIARLTDCVPPEIDPPTAGGERSILDAQTILDGAYNELVQSGTVEAGKISKTEGGHLRKDQRTRGRFQTYYAGGGREEGLCTRLFFHLALFFPAFTAQWTRGMNTNVSPLLYLFFDFFFSVNRIKYCLYLVALQVYGNPASIELGRQCLFADPRQQVHL